MWSSGVMLWQCRQVASVYEGRFTHETESPWPLHFKHSYWWKRQSRSKFASHYAWGTNGACECKMDVKLTGFLQWHRMGSCFMVTWIIFEDHLLEVGLTRTNWETMALRMLTTVGFFYFFHVWGPTLMNIHWNSIWLRAWSRMNQQLVPYEQVEFAR